MPVINFKSQNLDAHYSTTSKVTKPDAKMVVEGPPYVENKAVFSDKEANKKIRELDRDVYQQYQKEKKRESRKFWSVFLGSIATLLCVVGISKGIKHIFKKS